MKKLMATAASLILASNLYASYIVVLKDGTQYKAKDKWTVSGGKALIALENGNTLQLDPAMIDVAQTNRVNKLGLGNVKVLEQDTRTTEASTKSTSTLGSSLRLRRPPVVPTPEVATVPGSNTPVPGAVGPGGLGQDVISKFEQAYEKVGVFDVKIDSPGPARLRIAMTADNEERVFSVIKATAFLMTGVSRLARTPIENVELGMRTTVNGSAGQFQMTRADAELINGNRIKPEQYFVMKVIY